MIRGEEILDAVWGLLQYNPEEPLIFSSALFLFLFAGFSIVYALLQRHSTTRILFVTLFSYYFYYKSSGFYFVLLALVTISDFFIARVLEKCRSRWLVALSLFVDLGFLAYFKYANFFGAIWSDIVGNNFQPWDIFLPVGISFFVFQSLSYTIDVYRGKIKPLGSLLDYAFYVSFFPQLVAGPIVRASDFIPQIRRPLCVTREMFGRGIFLIVSGLFKKAVISDYISINFVERIFDNPSLYSGVENLLGVYGYTLQIYCDFSGYSDMAIGIALLLGFHFPANFDAPYKSDSITDFWRRWHISLSSWLRDYLYISLGGNRKGQVRTYINLIVTMLLGGLWHGANLNFVFWGGLHGVALAFHKLWCRVLGRDKHYHPTGLHRFLAVVLTFHFVAFCWVFFRNSTFVGAQQMLTQIFTQFHPELIPQLLDGYYSPLVFIALGYLLHFLPRSYSDRCTEELVRMPLLFQALVIVFVVYIVVQVKSSEIQPFIYFQF